MVPAPALVTPKAVLTIPLIVRSVAVVPSFATVKVRVAPRETGHDINAPVPVPVILLTVTPPPKLKAPVPDMVEPVAPHSRVTLAGGL